jgi:hypothetical protein
MIHQLIFAAPRPGLTEDEFHRYWLDVHAVKYASRIPQIRRYLISTRVRCEHDRDPNPNWSGVAEIWLANEQEQLASLQTPEFLHGARADEPRWAAFWRTVVLDTDGHVLRAGPGPSADEPDAEPGVKLILLAKRSEGLPLPEFRARSLGEHAEHMLQVPGLRRYLQCHTRDGAYALAEAPLDAAYQLWFDDVPALTDALASAAWGRAQRDLLSFVRPRYLHRMVAREHWIIGPESR